MNPADVAQSVLPLTSSDLSLFTLFWNAHWVVKTVMVGLLVCSVWVWAIAIDKIVLAADYKSGIPCVDAEAGAPARTAKYQNFGLGIYSEAFKSLMELSQNDLDLLYAYLDLAQAVVPVVEQHEAAYKGVSTLSTSAVKWSTGDTTAVEMLAAALPARSRTAPPVITT